MTATKPLWIVAPQSLHFLQTINSTGSRISLFPLHPLGRAPIRTSPPNSLARLLLHTAVQADMTRNENMHSSLAIIVRTINIPPATLRTDTKNYGTDNPETYECQTQFYLYCCTGTSVRNSFSLSLSLLRSFIILCIIRPKRSH